MGGFEKPPHIANLWLTVLYDLVSFLTFSVSFLLGILEVPTDEVLLTGFC
jgi:hypothetical protein